MASAKEVDFWAPFRPTAISLCCRKASLKASRQMACSTIKDSMFCGMVVGRIILFLIWFLKILSSSMTGTQRRTLARPAEATTLEIE